MNAASVVIHFYKYHPISLLSTAAGNTNAIATPLMYHTPQGVVYAASPAGTVNTLPEGFFFNYQTAAAAATHLHQTAHGKHRSNLPSSFKCFFLEPKGELPPWLKTDKLISLLWWCKSELRYFTFTYTCYIHMLYIYCNI